MKGLYHQISSTDHLISLEYVSMMCTVQFLVHRHHH